MTNGNGNGNGYQAEGDGEVWNEFTRSFSRVQSVLDRNRELIQQVNDNHQSRVPENMARNVPLIHELNGNISKVVSMYSDLGSSFSAVVKDRRHGGPARRDNGPNGGRARVE